MAKMEGLREMRVKLSVPGLLSGGLSRGMLYDPIRSVTAGCFPIVIVV